MLVQIKAGGNLVPLTDMLVSERVNNWVCAIDRVDK